MRWLDYITNSMGMNWANSRKQWRTGAWHAAVHGVANNWTWLRNWTTATANQLLSSYESPKWHLLPLEGFITYTEHLFTAAAFTCDLSWNSGELIAASPSALAASAVAFVLWRQLLSFSLRNHLCCFTLSFCSFLTSQPHRIEASRGLALH